MRPTYAEIDLSAIAFNIRQIKRRVGPTKVMAVVKANAYGHGMIEVARTALENGADYLGVALLEEGIRLREAGFQCPVLVFGGAFEDQISQFLQYDLEISLYSDRIAQALAREASESGKRAKVHIKVDTGMGWVGVPWEEASSFLQRTSQLRSLDIVGIYTHFATSDEKDTSFAYLQLRRFNRVLDEIKAKGINIPLRHAANSGAILNLPEAYLDMVRPGIMIYGYYPSQGAFKNLPLKPALTLKSRVIFVKKVAAGTSISYGRDYVTPRETSIATLPIGYADGYNRLLSNWGEVLIRGRRYPVVGRVCMDQIMVDVGEDEVQVGDEVVLIGRQGKEEISMYEVCQKLNTIPYEVCCWISERVPRVYL